MLLFSYLNYNKCLENDFNSYNNYYILAANNSFYDFFLSVRKEPLYFYLFWLSAKSNISFRLFTFISTLFVYFLGYIGLKKLTNHLLVILVFLLLPQVFSMSAHLMRQFAAGSLIYYALSLVKNDKKIASRLVYISSVLVHTTSVLFLPFFLMHGKGQERVISRSTVAYTYLSLMLFGAGFIAILYSNILQNIPRTFWTYPLWRLGHADYDLGSLSVISLFIGLIVVFGDLYKRRSFYLFELIPGYLVLLAVVLSPLSEVSFRIMTYTPFFLPLFISKYIKEFDLRIKITSLLFLMIYWLIDYQYISPWSYFECAQ